MSYEPSSFGYPPQPPHDQRNALQRWCERNKEVVTVVSVFLAFVSVVVAARAMRDAASYNQKNIELLTEAAAQDRRKFFKEQERLEEKQQAEEREELERRALEVLTFLEQTEARYALVDVSQLQISAGGLTPGPTEFRPAIKVRGVGGVQMPFFVLPRAYVAENRTQTINDPNGGSRELSYTVVRPIGPLQIRISPFECVSCNTDARMNYFLEAKELLPQLEPVGPEYYLHLARAAVDLGKAIEATDYILKAVASLEEEDGAYIARQAGEIGKTLLVMGEKERGYAVLEQSRDIYAKRSGESELKKAHELLLWEAQFACSEGDRARTERRLREFSALVSGYRLSRSAKSKVVEEAYGSCLAIISNYTEHDPELQVPATFELFDNARGWYSPVAEAKEAKPGSELPAGMYWATD